MLTLEVFRGHPAGTITVIRMLGLDGLVPFTGKKIKFSLSKIQHDTDFPAISVGHFVLFILMPLLIRITMGYNLLVLLISDITTATVAMGICVAFG
ncbi:hypothetical protein BDV38DRAFT_260569 [Aspergillus pseudotamarii]|uniref:Uncharacterized protein n=1 Tax=Aspergillus pseudotamarii TaxID=132259 RepID=A0A5N6SGB3_ASPPS|nr:uncharacterized protein BDV38DRAFT_260569 [Aspergillus pseudotamarii]KAE8132711.1 hypothetical protein BDV38DRAFT_260569 [Aspergillus pseudotamarii]